MVRRDRVHSRVLSRGGRLMSENADPREDIEMDMSDPCPPMTVISSAESRLLNPSRFVAGWWNDWQRCPRLARMLFKRNVIQQFRHSSIGIALAFAPAVITAVVFSTLRRSHFLDLEIGGVNSAFFSVCGVLMGHAFLEAFHAGRLLFVSYQGMLRRQSIPVEALIGATMRFGGFRVLIRILVLAGVFVTFSVPPASTLPLAIWGVVGITVAGLGLILAPINALNSDVNVLAAGLPLILFTVTPMFTIPPEGSLLSLIQAANPLAWLFESIRTAAYGAPGTLTATVLGPIVGLALLAVGAFVCRVSRPHVIERLLG